MGATGPTGLAGRTYASRSYVEWTSFSEVWFDRNQDGIRPGEDQKVLDVAAYLRQNPSLRVGIDVFQDPNYTDKYNQSLGERRVEAVRDALLKAGLPANKIQKGGIGQARFQCNETIDACRRVGVLIKNDN